MSSPQQQPASSSNSPPPPNAGNNADAPASNPTSNPTLGGILDELKARVLDYLPYESMEAALLALVAIAKEDRDGDGTAAAAAEDAEDDEIRRGIEAFITTLNITEASQLDGSLTKRFANVEEVNCLSFLRAADDSPDDKRIVVVCRETAARLVPVLSSISKLRRIFAGGGFVETDENGIERLLSLGLLACR